MEEDKQRSFSVEDISLIHLFGEQDSHLRSLEQRFDIQLIARDGKLHLQGAAADVQAAGLLLEHLIERVRDGETISEADLEYAYSVLEQRSRVVSGDRSDSAAVDSRVSDIPADDQPLEKAELMLQGIKHDIKVRTHGQARYVDALKVNDIVFSIGPAGTGKTYLAVAWAVRCLKEKLIERIILVRPAVEAGESLGFLPGDLQDKVDPYLRPLYDALGDMISFEKLQRFMQIGVIEVAPLAYMRGRTLSSSFVILDEAQNSTLPQMKMFLTRLGPGSRAVITGDITQIDLDSPETSGLIRIQDILQNVPGIEFSYLHGEDVVRHKLVRDIVSAFNLHETANGDQANGR